MLRPRIANAYCSNHAVRTISQGLSWSPSNRYLNRSKLASTRLCNNHIFYTSPIFLTSPIIHIKLSNWQRRAQLNIICSFIQPQIFSCYQTWFDPTQVLTSQRLSFMTTSRIFNCNEHYTGLLPRMTLRMHNPITSLRHTWYFHHIEDLCLQHLAAGLKLVITQSCRGQHRLIKMRING